MAWRKYITGQQKKVSDAVIVAESRLAKTMELFDQHRTLVVDIDSMTEKQKSDNQKHAWALQWSYQGVGTAKEDILKIIEDLRLTVMALQETMMPVN